MKRLKTMALLFFIGLLTSNAYSQSNFNYSLKDVDGDEIDLTDIKGEKLTVLDFWASWCKPCMKAIPKLIKLSEKYSEAGVSFIGINEDNPRNISKVAPLTHSLGINYPVLLDSEQELMNDFLVNSLPTLIILDKNGKIVFTHLGYSSGDETYIEETINKLLDEKG